MSPDFVTAPVGAGAELTCRVDCFCPGVIAEWSRSDGAPLSDMSVVNEVLVALRREHLLRREHFLVALRREHFLVALRREHFLVALRREHGK